MVCAERRYSSLLGFGTEPKLKDGGKGLYAVIEDSEAYTRCLWITDNFLEAIGKAYEYAAEEIEENGSGSVDQLSPTSLDNGYDLCFELICGRITTCMLILRCNPDPI